MTGKELSEARKSLCMTQKQLSEALGYKSTNAISQKEQGVRPITKQDKIILKTLLTPRQTVSI